MNENLNKQNCVSFKRKYNGKSPIERKILDFVRMTKKEWQLHRTTIGVLAGIIALIIASATFILKMLGWF